LVSESRSLCASAELAAIPRQGRADAPTRPYGQDVTLAPAPTGPTEFGHLLRYWRSVRAKSQLDLASEASTTPRYVSFVETGRAQPSRQMVVRLARALEVPLRERNELLLAAGYAPLYSNAPLASPLLERVDLAFSSMLTQHYPFPAVVLDRSWYVQRANDGAQALFDRLFAPRSVPEAANVLQLVIEPGPVRDHIRNWPTVVPALLDRASREAIGGVLDRATAELVRGLRARSDVAQVLAGPDLSAPAAPVVDLHFDVDGTDLRFFSVVSTIGTPIDVTAQELRVEAFFPADDETRGSWTRMVSELRPQ
jgi:transcriptional regulator with XRE-family HTH domain